MEKLTPYGSSIPCTLYVHRQPSSHKNHNIDKDK